MRFQLQQLNVWAIVTATLAYYLVGIPAFSLFGDVWVAAGFERAESWQPGAHFYVAPLLANLSVVVVLSVLAQATGAKGVRDGVVLGVLVALGVLVPTVGVDAMSPAHLDPWTIFRITAVYHLVGATLASVIVSSWRRKGSAGRTRP